MGQSSKDRQEEDKTIPGTLAGTIEKEMVESFHQNKVKKIMLKGSLFFQKEYKEPVGLTQKSDCLLTSM